MAEAIRRIEADPNNSKTEHEENLAAILEQIAANRKTIQDSLTILSELHESGLLAIVKGVLATRDKVGAIAMEQVNQPGMHHLIKNGINAIELLTAIEPEEIKQVFDSITSGLKHATQQTDQQPIKGTWGLLKAMKDPNVQASLTMMIKFLQGMGASLNASENKSQTE